MDFGGRRGVRTRRQRQSLNNAVGLRGRHCFLNHRSLAQTGAKVIDVDQVGAFFSDALKWGEIREKG